MKNKFLGILSIAMGLAGISSFFVASKEQLIFTEAPNFFLKYGLIIFLLSGIALFIFWGALLVHGEFIPKTKYERARMSIFSYIIASPAILILLFFVIILSESIFWKIIFSIINLYLICDTLKNVKFIIDCRRNGKQLT